MRPVLMVHGISSNARKTFGTPNRFGVPHPEGMYQYFINRGYQPGKDLFWYSYPTLKPIPVSARRLKREIEKVIHTAGVAEVNLLTFSLGGIIGKYYVISPLFQNEVRKLVMIAPPFLGSRWADWFKIPLSRSAEDFLFEGDGKALSPQVLSFENPFLQKLAHTPFPDNVETTIIAMKAVPNPRIRLIQEPFRWLTDWTGEGDLVVPIESSRINVDHYYELTEELSLKAFHRFLPYHRRIQELAFEALQ